MIRLVHTPAAQADFVEVYESLVRTLGERTAKGAVETLLERCEDLARFPEMGRRRPDLDGLGVQVRGIGYGGRLVVYAKRGDVLHVLRILREG